MTNFRSMTLGQLEALAIERGVYTDDRDIFGMFWIAALVMRLENDEWAERAFKHTFARQLAEVAAEVSAKIESGKLADPCQPAFSDPRFVAAPTPPGGFVRQPASGPARKIKKG